MTKFTPSRNEIVFSDERLDTTPAMLQVIPADRHVPTDGSQASAKSKSHVSDTPPPKELVQTQSTAPVAPQPASQELPVSPTKLTAAAMATHSDGHPTTEYAWPDSLLDVDMTSGDEPTHTTLLPDKDITNHPAVRRALTSLALGRMVDQDKDDIMASVPLPIISEPLLPSLIPLNEEESLLFSNIKPLQGRALIAAVGITADDLPPVAPRNDKGKRRSNSWIVREPTSPESGMITPHTQEPVYDTQSTSNTYEDLPLSQNLKKMVSAFPNMSEEHLSITLEKHENDLPTALAWMQTIADMRHL